MHTNSKDLPEPFLFRSFSENENICIVSCLKFYIGKQNQKMNESQGRFVIMYRKPHKEASSDTLSRWTKGEMSNAGIDASKKIGALIRSMKFLSPEVVLYLYKSTIRSCTEYCCHVWAGAPSCYLELLDKLQKQICRTVGPSLATSLEPLAHCRNVASLSLFYRYYFGRCSSELVELVPLPYSRGRSTHYSDRLHNFSATIPRCYTDVYVNSFFPHTARLWNSLPIECFPLTYDLSDFKSRINRYLLTVGSF